MLPEILLVSVPADAVETDAQNTAMGRTGN